jgi:hypothetical protein
MTTDGSSVAEDEHLCECQFLGMRDGEQRRSPANRRKTSLGAPMKLKLRRSPAAHDFDVAPEDAARVAGTERFHGRLLGGKTPGEVNGGNAPP